MPLLDVTVDRGANTFTLHKAHSGLESAPTCGDKRYGLAMAGNRKVERARALFTRERLINAHKRPLRACYHCFSR
jgi:hypothetical protein